MLLRSDILRLQDDGKTDSGHFVVTFNSPRSLQFGRETGKSNGLTFHKVTPVMKQGVKKRLKERFDKKGKRQHSIPPTRGRRIMLPVLHEPPPPAGDTSEERGRKRRKKVIPLAFSNHQFAQFRVGRECQ